MKFLLLPSFAMDALHPQDMAEPAPFMLDAMRAAADAGLERPAPMPGRMRLLRMQVARRFRAASTA